MPSIDTSIEVNAPLDRVSTFWTNFERFPQFMENVEEVRRTGPNATHWVANIAGNRLEWDATTNVSEREVSWAATGNTGHSGRVTFDPVAQGRTRVNVHIDYTLPSKLQETLAETFRIDERAVNEDLKNFQREVERS